MLCIGRTKSRGLRGIRQSFSRSSNSTGNGFRSKSSRKSSSRNRRSYVSLLFLRFHSAITMTLSCLLCVCVCLCVFIVVGNRRTLSIKVGKGACIYSVDVRIGRLATYRQTATRNRASWLAVCKSKLNPLIDFEDF